MILNNAFKDYKGIIISGGTNTGVCKLAGTIKQRYGNKIKLYGYIPINLPTDGSVSKDNRYEHIITSGRDFGILECLQYWYDILNAKINPSKIKLIGINGGKIAELEFLIVIIFGAQVGIIEDSGGVASELIKNQWWAEKKTNPQIKMKNVYLKL